MNLILCLLIVVYFCILEVNCRSVQVDGDARSVLDVIADNDGNHDAESGGIFSWIRLKPLLRREVQRIDETNKISPEPAETTPSDSSKQDKNLSDDVEHKNEGISLKAESQIADIGTSKSELTEHFDQHEDPNTESHMSDFTYNTTDVEIHETDHPLVASDFQDNVLTDILNQTSDSIFLPALNANSSSGDSLEFDETSVLSEGGLIATIQEVSTIGFELLIDSETKQNSILAELIDSQSNLIDDDDNLNSTNDDDINFVTIELDHSDENELEETERNTEPTSNPDSACCIDEVETENVEPDKTEFDSDENKTVKTELVKIENTESDTDKDKDENSVIEDNTGKPEFGEIENVNSELELSDSDQDNISTEIATTEPQDPNCPEPGWCIFWFMALDLCETNSHCHGSLICCTIGCSKTCIDPNEEFLF